MYTMYYTLLQSPSYLHRTAKCSAPCHCHSFRLSNIDSSPAIPLFWENTPEDAIRSITVEAQELKRAALRYVAVGQDPSLRVPAAEVLRSSRSFEGRDAMLQLLQEPNLGGWLMGVKAKRGQFSAW